MPNYNKLAAVQGLNKGLTTNEKMAFMHLIGHFNVGRNADNESSGKIVYVSGNNKGHAVVGASVVVWNRDPRFVSMRIDRQGYHTSNFEGKQRRFCRYACQWGSMTFASINVEIDQDFGKKRLRNALIQSLNSNGKFQTFVYAA